MWINKGMEMDKNNGQYHIDAKDDPGTRQEMR